MHPGVLLPTLVLGLAALVAAPAFAADNGRPLGVSAESVLLLDPEGRSVFAKNPEVERAPASLVKLMTLYLAFEDLEAGHAELDEMVVISSYAAHTPRYRMGLRTGERVAVRTLMEGVAIASANDAATALAERLAGDEGSFVDRMNVKATDLGLTATRFGNPHGLPHPLQRSNARDLAVLTMRLLQDYPMARTMLGGQMFVFNGRVYARHIPLFNNPGGVQALKTGFTNEAGYNLSVSAWRDGQQFVMILLGARSRSMSFLDAKKVLHFGFVEAGLEEPATEKPRARPVLKKKPLRPRRATAVKPVNGQRPTLPARAR